MAIESDRKDALLAAAFEERLWKDSGLRTLEAGHIRLRFRQGIARMAGHVVKALNRSKAHEIAMSVPGIPGVQNELVLDDELKVQVAAALARDKRTRPYILMVGVQHGWINLVGTVPDAATQATQNCIRQPSFTTIAPAQYPPCPASR